MKDGFGREINYLRIAVTDKCNLRCQYCIPNDNITFLKQNQLLTYEEWLRLINIFADLGVTKLKVSGGEPLLRKDIGGFLSELKNIKKIKKLGITTNGTNTMDFLDILDGYSINLSLDTINSSKFDELTQRTNSNQVFETLESLIKLQRLDKINAVVMKGKNEESLIDMISLIKENNIHLRFIESMPFNGDPTEKSSFISAPDMIKTVQKAFPNMYKVTDEKNGTANLFKIEGYKGTVGFIPAFSRTICGDCNRIRVTSEGILKTCLYDDGVFNLKDLIRNGATDKELAEAIIKKVDKKPKDGFVAENERLNHNFESMTKIGG